jgi:hypothetical protein
VVVVGCGWLALRLKVSGPEASPLVCDAVAEERRPKVQLAALRTLKKSGQPPLAHRLRCPGCAGCAGCARYKVQFTRVGPSPSARCLPLPEVGASLTRALSHIAVRLGGGASCHSGSGLRSIRGKMIDRRRRRAVVRITRHLPVERQSLTVIVQSDATSASLCRGSVAGWSGGSSHGRRGTMRWLWLGSG